MNSHQEEIEIKLNKLSGRKGEIAKQLVVIEKSNYYNSDREKQKLISLLNENSPNTLQEVYDNGPRQMFEAIHGKDISDLIGNVIVRQTDYVYIRYYSSRSFRTKSINTHLPKVVETLLSILFPWDKYDIVQSINKVEEDEEKDEIKFLWQLYSDVLAVYIDNGDKKVIDGIKDICLGDNNTQLLNHRIINAIVRSSNKELYQLLGNMLLAAKLQEGLRQSILENGDNGHIEFLKYIFKLVLDHDLLRYSSAVRAVDTWMGLSEAADDKRVVAKLARLGCSFLSDEKARDEALKSKDVIEIYTALWAVAVYEVNDVLEPLYNLMKGEKYQKIAALSFAIQLQNSELQFEMASRCLNETDMDVFTLVMQNYPLSTPGWYVEQKQFFEEIKNTHYIADKNLRDRQFQRLAEIIPLIPENGCKVSGKPFEWSYFELSRNDIFSKMLVLAAYDLDAEKISVLIENVKFTDSDNRMVLIKNLISPPKNEKERNFLFNSLSDKSMSVRDAALKEIKKLSLSDDESVKVISLLALKSGDIRQHAIEILLNLSAYQVGNAVKTLLSDKLENKRLAGLDMITQLLKKNELKKEQLPELLKLMPKVTDKEKIQIDAITSDVPRYNKENGFGLYDADYNPTFPPLLAEKKKGLELIFSFKSKRIIQLFDDLCNRIHENKDYTYVGSRWGNQQEDVVLGTSDYIILSNESGLDEQRHDFRIKNYVLQDVWCSWMTDNKVTTEEMTLFKFVNEVKDYGFTYELDYLEWAENVIKKNCNVAEVAKLIKYMGKREYGSLALGITDLLWFEIPETERFEVLWNGIIDFVNIVPEADWAKPIEKDDDDGYTYYSHNNEPDTFSDASEVSFFIEELSHVVDSDKHFEKYLALCFELGRRCGLFYITLEDLEIARGVELGLLKIDALYKTYLLHTRNSCYIRDYSGKTLYPATKTNLKKYPFIQKVIEDVVSRVIEIELQRGDSNTEVSKLAGDIGCHRGVDNFSKTLIAMNNETFVRGYIYSGNTRKEILSSLLKASYPAPEDTTDTLRIALDGKIDDKRLLEAAMYSPGWLKIISAYLGWKGLESAAWYFHAHINESFSAEKETEVARYSPVSSQDFNDGAFDVNWFKEAYKALGKERFDILYDCAKYLTEGINHRRAQMFADATLGKFDLKELKKEIKDKRNKDKLLSYSLIPFGKNKQKDTLERYEFIQEFLNESKQFGAQRRASEAKVSAIALDNLARNAGFADSLRFAWRMETLKIQTLKAYFEPRNCDGIDVYIQIDNDGVAHLVCEKDGKKMAAVPAKLKKDKYIAECKEVVASLKSQFKRAKSSLEQSMVNCDCFEMGELKDLMEHPVISPLLQKLLFAADQRTGAYCELNDLPDNALVSIAHPYNLFKSGKWLEAQRYSFENKLIQPFKQIFRELYLINEDELAEKTLSRRYVGHQVQPQKTVALLKGRGWTVDYEEGLQRVYYKENIVATMYAAADWFSPADIEAPTLETVRFFDRKTHKDLPLDAIPPVIFSEVMRDIDLVVSVAHVGGVDPEASHSTVEMRAVIVKELLTLLKVENVTLKERFAHVKGTLGEYTVHLGSGVVHKMGKGAINILAIQSQHRGRIFLPFADEDPRTAEIISKILLLAEDQKIKDPAILAQLK